MILKNVFENINFAIRYRDICDKYNDFDGRMLGNQKKIYLKVLNRFDYEFKYFTNGSFFEIKSEIDIYEFQFNIVLKDGQIETLFFMKKNNIDIEPSGRVDFLTEKLKLPFERKLFNLPLFSSEDELFSILEELFLIFEDLKKEFLKFDM
tara:strand:- start:197 stop:646 length:450 start_codon:yes stop_codon:yes gene_type:complete